MPPLRETMKHCYSSTQQARYSIATHVLLLADANYILGITPSLCNDFQISLQTSIPKIFSNSEITDSVLKKRLDTEFVLLDLNSELISKYEISCSAYNYINEKSESKQIKYSSQKEQIKVTNRSINISCVVSKLEYTKMDFVGYVVAISCKNCDEIVALDEKNQSICQFHINPATGLYFASITEYSEDYSEIDDIQSKLSFSLEDTGFVGYATSQLYEMHLNKEDLGKYLSKVLALLDIWKI
jgi:hypothetical protein